MQLVSDLQQRPKKGRLKMEKKIVMFYDLCSLVQMTVWYIHIVTTMIAAGSTFVNYIMVPNDFELTPSLVYKTQNCTYTTVRNIYAFTNVNMTFTADSINDVFVDLAVQLRLAIFVCAVTFLIGGINRASVEMNFFVIKYRNFYFWKDILSATELILLAYVTQIAAAINPPGSLLRGYLEACGVQSHIYLPYVLPITLWVFIGVGFLTYVVGIILYLNNTLPKYGVMTPAEIEEYKAWLRARQAEQEQSRLLIEEAKKAHARIHLMNTADFRAGQQLSVPQIVAPTVPTVMGPDGMLYPYPYAALGPPGLPPGGGNARMPPPQLFGAGMVPQPVPMQPGMMPTYGPWSISPAPYPNSPQPSMGPPMMVPPTPMQPSPVNMPRRRLVNQEGVREPSPMGGVPPYSGY